VAGVAVTAAFPTSGLGFLEGSTQWPNPGLIWLTEPAVRSLATSAYPLGYVLNLELGRPRRVLAGVLSVAITVSGIVAVLFAHATVAVAQFGMSAGTANPNLFDVGFTSRAQREDQVLLIITVLLATLAAVNAIFITRATVQDSRHAYA